METAQRRPVPFGRLITVTLAGAALIAALGLLAANNTFELPVIGGNETTTGIRDDAPIWNPPADRMTGGSPHSSAVDASSDQVTTKAGHRYHVYLGEGRTFTGPIARPAGTRAIPVERSNHRYFFSESAGGADGETYPENQRIGQLTD